MKRLAALNLVGTLLLGTAVAQTSAVSQTNVSASQSASASDGKSGVEVDSRSSAQAAQSANVSNKGAQAAATSQLEAGSSIHATLQKPVDARKNKQGDAVMAKTTEDVKSEGKVVIPRGSRIVGHVTEVKAYEKNQADSAVSIVFDHAVLKNGERIPMSLAVQAVSSSAVAAQAEEDSLLSSGDMAAAGGVSAAGSGMARSGGGMVGAVRSTTGSVVNTAGRVGGAGVNAASGVGASSSLNSNSRGVIGLRGLSLSSSTSSTNSATFTSKNSNVHLDAGTEMILQVQK